MTAIKYYAVKNGRKNGIYTTWKECEEQIKSFPGQEYKSFKTLEEANAYINKGTPIKERTMGYYSKEEITNTSAVESNDTPYRGKIVNIFSERENWSSVKMRLFENDKPGRLVTVIGIKGPVEGAFYNFDAKATNHPTYGEQLDVKGMKCTIEQNETAVFARFLTQYIKGIGENCAKIIYDRFGDNLFEVLDTNPNLLLQVPKLTPKKISKIVDYYKTNYKQILVAHELYNFTEGQITVNQSNKIYEKYKDNTLDVVKNNPYVLTEIAGFGFKTVDKIALSTGLKKNSPFRLKSAIMYILDEVATAKGHTYLLANELEEYVMEMFMPLNGLDEATKKLLKDYLAVFRAGGDASSILDSVSETNKEKLLKYSECYKKYLEMISDVIVNDLFENKDIYVSDDGKQLRIYSYNLYQKEQHCAELLSVLSKRSYIRKNVNTSKFYKFLKKLEKENGYSLDPEQVKAAENCLQNRVSCLTGGAGRGKTVLIKLVISAYTGDVILCAPTGRAAQRMAEATGHEASTIHRTIYDYVKNEPKELPENCLIIVDEASMINLQLGYDLVKAAFDANAQIMFVGDQAQLPPIGAGNFFAQLLKSNTIAVNRLEKAYRQMGSINENADLVNNGSLMSSFTEDDMFKTVHLPSAEDDIVKKTLLDLWKKARDKYDVSDIRILSPMKAKGSCSVQAFNQIIREYENPLNSENKISGSTFRIGDRVLQLQNEYKMLFKNEKGKLVEGPLFNGETGTIIALDEYDEDEYAVISLDSGETVYYPIEKLIDLDLAYATTVHKSQGSEYKCVILFIATYHSIMLKKNLLYTALTRCKNEMYLCYNTTKGFNPVNKAITDDSYDEIHCSLAESIN